MFKPLGATVVSLTGGTSLGIDFRELKRDPLLKVPKAYVTIRVGLSGQVENVSIPPAIGTAPYMDHWFSG